MGQKGSLAACSPRKASFVFLCPWLACVAFHAQEYKWYFLGVVTVLITLEAPKLQCFNKVVDVLVVSMQRKLPGGASVQVIDVFAERV